MITLIIILLELFFILGGVSVLLLGQSVPTLLKHKKPLRHLFLMGITICKIAPWKAVNRLSWAFINGFIVFSIFANSLIMDNPKSFYELLVIILACINVLVFFFSIFALIVSIKRMRKEKNWIFIRLKAHHTVYGVYPKNGEYGTAMESLGI